MRQRAERNIQRYQNQKKTKKIHKSQYGCLSAPDTKIRMITMRKSENVRRNEDEHGRKIKTI